MSESCSQVKIVPIVLLFNWNKEEIESNMEYILKTIENIIRMQITHLFHLFDLAVSAVITEQQAIEGSYPFRIGTH